VSRLVDYTLGLAIVVFHVAAMAWTERARV
jgi:hypothetical protein